MSTQPSDPAKRTLIMIHGRGWKPAAETLEGLWRSAIATGLDRDHKDAGGSALLETVNMQFVYFGDFSNELLQSAGGKYDPELDLVDRQQALRALSALKNKKRFRRQYYESVPGKSSLKEFLVDLGAPILSALHVTNTAIGRKMPEVAAYFRNTNGFQDAARQRLAIPLREALARNDRILLVSHCLGSVIAYDTLWQAGHEPVGSDFPHVPRVDTWITLGSPLGDEFVKHHLAGAKSSNAQRFPTNIINWLNIAAEDDYTCHDETVANDYARMLDRQLVSQIKDYSIYNLAERYGRSNPHHSAGYLIHPRFSGLLADWLQIG